MLQFAYFTRSPDAVIGVDPVEDTLKACEANLRLAEQQNPWFREDFNELRARSTLDLPVDDPSSFSSI